MSNQSEPGEYCGVFKGRHLSTLLSFTTMSSRWLTESVTHTYLFDNKPCLHETGQRAGEPMAYRTSYRNVLTRGLAVIALLCIYGLTIMGASALLLGASTTSALARGGGGHGGGGGFHGGGFRGAGFGFGLGLGYPYYGYGGYYPYYGDAGVCYVERRRVLTRYGWRIRRVSVCE
jgi:hypothetical protein